MSTPAEASDLLINGPWKHREITANGVRLHLVEAGTGPLVVLLHGFPEFWWAWRSQIPALAEAGYRVVAPDLRGYAGSDKPPRGYDMFTASADIAGLIRALGEADAVLIGHGIGGLIAWTTAALHGGAVRALAAVSAPHPRRLRREFTTSGPQRKALAHIAGYQLPRRPEQKLIADGGFEVGRIMRSWSGPAWRGTEDFRRASEHYREAIRIPQAAYGALEYYRWAIRSLLRPDGVRYAQAMKTPIKVPTLHLHGLKDPVLLRQTAAGSNAYVQGVYEWRTFDGAGHFLPEERPDEVNEALLHWLARH